MIINISTFKNILYEEKDFHLLLMSSFASRECSGTELPVSVTHLSIYQGLLRKKKKLQPNLGNRRVTILK